MSDYTNTFSKTTGNTIEASDFSTEFDAIEVSSATKADESGATLTTATLTSPKINEILDTNGNELVKFTTTASAVNEVTLANAATGNNPAFTASGEDVGIDIEGVTFKNGAVDVSGAPINAAIEYVASAAIGAVTTKNYTGVPSWAKKITIMFENVSTNTTGDDFIIQLGDSGGIENSGYTSRCNELGGGSTSGTSATVGFIFAEDVADSTGIYGTITIVLADSVNFLYMQSGSAVQESLALDVSAGYKDLTTVATQFTLTTVAGTGTFDSGNISILYEG